MIYDFTTTSYFTLSRVYVLNEVSNLWMTNFQANICFPFLKKSPTFFYFFFCHLSILLPLPGTYNWNMHHMIHLGWLFSPKVKRYFLFL